MGRSIRSDPRVTKDGDGDLAGFPEVAVVLGGGFSENGEPSASTAARARTAAHLAQKRPSLAIIASGSHGEGPAPARSEAAIMADLIAATGVARERYRTLVRVDAVNGLAPLVGRWSDRIGRKPLIVWSRIAIGLLIYPGFLWLNASPTPKHPQSIPAPRKYCTNITVKNNPRIVVATSDR